MDEFNTPLSQLMESSEVLINLKDFIDVDDPEDFYDQWRWRIARLDVMLLDEADLIVPSPDEISFGVSFPSLFNDTDINKEVHAFLGQKFYCRSTYETSSKSDLVKILKAC